MATNSHSERVCLSKTIYCHLLIKVIVKKVCLTLYPYSLEDQQSSISYCEIVVYAHF